MTVLGCSGILTDPTGQKLPANCKSVAYRFHYRSATGTLTAAEFDAIHKKVLDALTAKLGVKFRYCACNGGLRQSLA